VGRRIAVDQTAAVEFGEHLGDAREQVQATTKAPAVEVPTRE
jgi:hypothetical protein